jgi:hypothetical protein
MICVYAKECNSTKCPQKVSHPRDRFCDGGTCSWGDDTHCVPESNRELVKRVLDDMAAGKGLVNTEHYTDRIMEIFEEDKGKEVAAL